MSIGVFGDSYADCSINDKENIGWPKHLIDNLGMGGDIYSASGSSTWWSYENFLQQKSKHDIIVFCYSAYSRWPVLPEDCKGLNYCVHDAHGHKQVEPYVPYYFDLFTDQLLDFIQRNVFRSVNEICEREQKYLINLQSAPNFITDVPTRFPNYYNLMDISYAEKIFFNGKLDFAHVFHSKYSLVDTRRCHFSDKNNERMGHFLKNLIQERLLDIQEDISLLFA